MWLWKEIAMPFMEISDFGGPLEARKAAAEEATRALVEAYKVSPDIVTCYFHDSRDAYAHAGKFGEDAEKKRIFIKLHAFPRPKDQQNRAARALATAFAESYGLPLAHVAIYFVARDETDAYHGGISAADMKQTRSRNS
ncbi:hypothetical protein [Thioclava sp. GXIMD2076]|uniref:4-oxalocrotonate tautomerase n=1 Tax=Thioclava kandeliae TaxID=3070818 RepID=A0ABV1SLN4_9RHOB